MKSKFDNTSEATKKKKKSLFLSMEDDTSLNETLLHSNKSSPEETQAATVSKSKWTILVLAMILLLVYLTVNLRGFHIFVFSRSILWNQDRSLGRRVLFLRRHFVHCRLRRHCPVHFNDQDLDHRFGIYRRRMSRFLAQPRRESRFESSRKRDSCSYQDWKKQSDERHCRRW